MMARAGHRAVAGGLAAILVIMTAGAAQAAAAAGASAGGGRVREPPGPAQWRCTGYHAVVRGETCESVARDARITVEQLRELNKGVVCAALMNWGHVCVRGYVIGG
ncbi:hypothetical protein HU200_026831 [Digitaria exilis]|uniref:LysM domain-containing protein n=1 Tax=Digitaria exilis TaxID=1010633 RepID=A0A835BXT8_9POAL|nr:hypothetical protein HU200_026831 [Digitaria exilis]